jgi:hypothetical protein
VTDPKAKAQPERAARQMPSTRDEEGDAERTGAVPLGAMPRTDREFGSADDVRERKRKRDSD